VVSLSTFKVGETVDRFSPCTFDDLAPATGPRVASHLTLVNQAFAAAGSTPIPEPDPNAVEDAGIVPEPEVDAEVTPKPTPTDEGASGGAGCTVRAGPNHVSFPHALLLALTACWTLCTRITRGRSGR